MNFKEIQDLIKLINKTNLTEFKMKDGEFNISIKKGDEQGDKAIVVQQPLMQYPSAQMPVQQAFQAPAAPAAPSAPAPVTDAKEEKADTSNYLEVRSPIVGTFYRSASPENPPFAKVGDKISTGDVVCYS